MIFSCCRNTCTSVVKYADDVSFLYFLRTQADDNLQSERDNLVNCSSRSGLPMNSKKCRILDIMTRKDFFHSTRCYVQWSLCRLSFIFLLPLCYPFLRSKKESPWNLWIPLKKSYAKSFHHQESSQVWLPSRSDGKNMHFVYLLNSFERFALCL